MKRFRYLIFGGLVVAGVIGCAVSQTTKSYSESPQFSEGEFRNDKQFSIGGLAQTAKITWRYMTEDHPDTEPVSAIPVRELTTTDLRNETADTVLYRLGHSTILLVVDGRYWLIDPVFSERVSPVSWAGPKRFHQPPMSIDQLPELEGVLISHDHYDHLDKASINQLKDKVEHFVVPLGIGDYLTRWGVSQDQVTELDWWQSVQRGSLNLTATPAQHFSGRGLTDRNKTLWASWVITTPQHKLFYSGDSGYFDGFKKIGERFGPFDLTIIENGAYNELWSQVHMNPEESLQAHKDLKGRVMLPVHNGTFNLAMHPWYEPLERISELAWEASVPLAVPMIGERYEVGQEQVTRLWWETFMPGEMAAAQ